MKTLVTMSLPLAQQKRQDRELELAKLLATGHQIAGAIVFSSKYDMFEFLRSSGDTEVPLEEQIPALRLHDRELGPVVRGATYRVHYMKSDIGYYVRLFTRVIVGKSMKMQSRLQPDKKSELVTLNTFHNLGCPDVQIQGVVQYLNSEMRGNTLPAKFDRYDDLIWLCRCVLHPEYKYFTRRNKLKPFVWVPMPRTETKAVMTLGVSSHYVDLSGKRFTLICWLLLRMLSSTAIRRRLSKLCSRRLGTNGQMLDRCDDWSRWPENPPNRNQRSHSRKRKWPPARRLNRRQRRYVDVGVCFCFILLLTFSATSGHEFRRQYRK